MAEANLGEKESCSAVSDNNDDDEFGLDEDELAVKFNSACKRVESLVADLSQEQLLKFYGLYKQATVGQCMTGRPSWYEFEAKQKWNTWKSLGSMSKVEAMNKYIELLKTFVSDEDETKQSKCGWVTVSSMAIDSDECINDEDKTIFDWVKENDLVKIKELIRARDVGTKDGDGMGLIHWAADRGNLAVIKFLVTDMNTDIEMRDAEGQTALHYAAFCGHKDVLEFLLSKGASKAAADNEGTTPKDVASDKDIEQTLS